jgi:hypothetical protein
MLAPIVGRRIAYLFYRDLQKYAIHPKILNTLLYGLVCNGTQHYGSWKVKCLGMI